jgi:hypothetical protein
MNTKFLMAVVLFQTLPTQALAMTGGETEHLLSVGAGIASPSITSAIGENPAGLVNNQRLKLLASAYSAGNDSFDPLGYGATLFTGTGSVGLGLGYQGRTGDGTTGSLVYGLAGEISALKMALGVAGSFALEDQGGGGRVGLDVGALFNSKGDLTFGVTAFGVEGGPDAYGAGIAYAMRSGARLALDAGVNNDLEGLRIKPGLLVSVDKIQLAFGYGLKVTDGGGSHIGDGLSLGLGFELGQNFHFQAYYNQLAKYFLGLTFRF